MGMKFPRELGAEAGGYPRKEMGRQDSPEVWRLSHHIFFEGRDIPDSVCSFQLGPAQTSSCLME